MKGVFLNEAVEFGIHCRIRGEGLCRVVGSVWLSVSGCRKCGIPARGSWV